MAFEMQVVSHPPLTGEKDPVRLAKTLFSLIGYTARKGPDHGVSFRILYECFLLHPSRQWSIEELAAAAQTTVPSVYRHINKLRDLDIIEDLHIEEEGKRKRVLRLRYGDFSRAWTFVESHFQQAIETYRESVDHLESLLKSARRGA